MNIFVFDTETSTTEPRTFFSRYNNLVFDIGGVIYDTDNRKILDSFNYVVLEIYSNRRIMSNYVFGKDKLKYYEDVPSKCYANIVKELKALLKKYNVTTLAAYNCNFDIEAIETTNKYIGTNFLLNDYEIYDIYAMACAMLTHDESYIEFCEKNGKVSAKGNILSNAETVYSYLRQNAEFIENHTALEDAEIEAYILDWVLAEEQNRNITISRAPNPMAWRLVQRRKK